MEIQRNRKEKHRRKKDKTRNCDFVVEERKRYSGEDYGKQFEDEICVEHPYHSHVLKIRDNEEVNCYFEGEDKSDLAERLALEEIERDYNETVDFGDEIPADITIDSGFTSAIETTIEKSDDSVIQIAAGDAGFEPECELYRDNTALENTERAMIVECHQEFENYKTTEKSDDSVIYIVAADAEVEPECDFYRDNTALENTAERAFIVECDQEFENYETIERGDDFEIHIAADAEFESEKDAETVATQSENKDRAFVSECDQKFEEDKEKRIYTKQVSVEILNDEIENVETTTNDICDNKVIASVENNKTECLVNDTVENVPDEPVTSEIVKETNDDIVQRKQSVVSAASSVVSKTESIGSPTESIVSATDSATGKVKHVPSKTKSRSSSLKSLTNSLKRLTSSVKSKSSSVESVSSKTRSASSKSGSKSGSVKSLSNVVESTVEARYKTNGSYNHSRLSLISSSSGAEDFTKSRLKRDVDAYERRNKIKQGYCRQADYMEKCFDITNDKVGPYPGAIEQYRYCLKHCTKMDLELQRQKPLLEEDVYKHIPYIDEETK